MGVPIQAVPAAQVERARAALDDGAMWPTSYALTGLTPTVEREITAIVRRAAG